MTEPPAELVGVVSVEVTGAGSKSEMLSVVLHPDPGVAGAPVVLRRRDASSLSAEPELAQYDGHRVRVTGLHGWSTFVVDSIEPVDDERVDEHPAGGPTDQAQAGE